MIVRGKVRQLLQISPVASQKKLFNPVGFRHYQFYVANVHAALDMTL